MSLCKEFVCAKKETCIYESSHCKVTCLIALDAYICNGCVLHSKCSIERKNAKNKNQ